MTRTALILAALAALAACGVDGPPQKPSAAKSGLTVSGEARMGVTGRL